MSAEARYKRRASIGRVLNRALRLFFWKRELTRRAEKSAWQERGAGNWGAEKILVILQRRIAELNEAVLERFVLRARRAVGLKGTVNVLVAGSNRLRSLNRDFRGQDKATDVLSFPSQLPERRGQMRAAGDVAISADIAAENAVRLGHSAAEEIKVLVLHGILHLAGFDHERDNGQMARKELKLRQELRLPVGLIERTEPPGKKALHHRGARRTV